jgi:hypothetical protein
MRPSALATTEEGRDHSVLKGMLKQSMGRLRGSKEGAELSNQEEEIEALILLLHQVERWGLDIPKEEVQDSMDEMLKEYVLGLEESWGGEGKEKPFSLKIISLAEKLGFNMEKFSKIVGSATSKTLQ